jgi:lipopolysaccharide/colanic/teichoic acid biosynthesis glycosyltransferase
MIVKRAIDLFFSSVGLIILSPLFIFLIILVRVDSKGPIFFRQERVGKDGTLFRIYKFRTMVEDAEKLGPQVSKIDDRRITRVGNFLRKYKLDEIPQLLNVLRGEMSLVGPRPEVPRYVEKFGEDYREILRVKPGITDYASLRFREEAKILNQHEDVEDKYLKEILPDKIEYYKRYIRDRSIARDLGLIFKTLIHIIK